MQNHIICLKWGKKYDSIYVNNLYRSTRRFCDLPFTFNLITDDPSGIEHSDIKIIKIPEHITLKGWWIKPLILNKGILHSLEGIIIFFDLDIVIINSIDELFTYGDKNDFYMIRDWNENTDNKEIKNSSIMRWNTDTFCCDFSELLDPNKCEQIIKENKGGDQEYISKKAKKIIKTFPDDWVSSFKFDRCWETINPLTKVVVFHGNPNPHEAISGYENKFPPTPWIGNFWR